uniref:Uncharacterized protein n=1 Tax=Chelonoidis abingdonii TaxID=106734 RepID=A0A8C0GX86_CHEAB
MLCAGKGAESSQGRWVSPWIKHQWYVQYLGSSGAADLSNLVQVKLNQIIVGQVIIDPGVVSVIDQDLPGEVIWLAAGFRNGGEATKCFQMALREDEANGEFLAGLAIAVFASWTHSHKPVFWNAAREKLGAIIHEQQQNYEAKVYLAKILKRTDRQQAEALLEDVVQNSLDPEVLRHAAMFFLPEFLEKAISILERAISLNPNYHLLHYDLGVCYKMQLRGDNSSRREEILAAAIEAFKKAVRKDPVSVFSKLALAEMYGENTPHYQEEIYLNLTSEMPSLSKKCQQAVSLHWGDFLFYKQKSLWEAAQIYKAGFAIPDNYLERQQLKRKLEKVAEIFQILSLPWTHQDLLLKQVTFPTCITMTFVLQMILGSLNSSDHSTCCCLELLLATCIVIAPRYPDMDQDPSVSGLNESTVCDMRQQEGTSRQMGEHRQIVLVSKMDSVLSPPPTQPLSSVL